MINIEKILKEIAMSSSMCPICRGLFKYNVILTLFTAYFKAVEFIRRDRLLLIIFIKNACL